MCLAFLYCFVRLVGIILCIAVCESVREYLIFSDILTLNIFFSLCLWLSFTCLLN
ncbi:hypothetical protein E2C01_020482 [Portunus trituberculatus]|uniref:Uncharacterized protein n=1 Tax=Portunus trituberculatus TaxID=210409 RepID=A0A5B7E1L5_PORTR|nr:hypothetical protein [Portunus trituberculatus]